MAVRAKTYRVGKTNDYATIIGGEKPKRYVDVINSRKSDAFVVGTKYRGNLYIQSVHVKKSLRKQGIGKRIVNKLIRDTKPKEVYAAGIKKSAKGFWRKLGIEGVGGEL